MTRLPMNWNVKPERAAIVGGVALLLASFICSGCNPPPDLRSSELDQNLPKAGAAAPTPVLTAMAGVPVKAGVYKYFAPAVIARPNPFALTSGEEAYEKQQEGAYVATTQGSFPLYYEAPPAPPLLPTVEPQPFRRLMGVMIGQSISAIVDMGNGKIEEIYPGEHIPGTPWVVQSIDDEKAVLVRVGSNILPHEVVVRLESAPANQTQAAPPQGSGPGGAGGSVGAPGGGGFGMGGGPNKFSVPVRTGP